MATVTIEAIKQAVCAEFGIPMIEMTSDRRARAVTRPRHVAIFLCRELTPKSLPVIGQYFGNRDHTTVMSAVKRIISLLRDDPEFASQVDRVRMALATDTVAEHE